MNLDDDDYLNEEATDLRAIAARLWPRRWWILGIALLVAAMFAIASFVMKPVYRATTVLIPATNEQSGLGSLSSTLGSLGGLASLAGINISGGNARTEEALAVLKSRDFTERFIRDENLLPILYSNRWDAKQSRWTVDGKKVPTTASAAKFFQKRVRTVAQDKKTQLVTMNIEWHDPEMAAAWANRMIARLNEEMRTRAIVSTNASLQYLEKELETTATIDTRQAINRLMETQINQRMYANVTQEYAFRVVDRALPPELNDEVRPNKPVLVAVGLFVGLLLGSLVAFIMSLFADSRRRATTGTG